MEGYKVKEGAKRRHRDLGLKTVKGTVETKYGFCKRGRGQGTPMRKGECRQSLNPQSSTVGTGATVKNR